MNDFLLQAFILLRFLCFIALLYLLLHIWASRLIAKPEHKVLWFFSVLTAPLTRPVRAWTNSDTPEQRVRWMALAFYGVLWLIGVALSRMIGAFSI
jgi:hypothetical protein